MSPIAAAVNQITFIATKAFEKAARRLFSATQYSGPRAKLAMNSALGDLIPKTGGGEIFFLACYPKSAKIDLSPAETKVVASVIEDIKRARR